MRILIVEDDPVLADGLKVGLGLGGVTADLVTNCTDASAALAASRYDAAVLDVMLPDGSGIDFLRRLRREGDHTPILVLTAQDNVDDRIIALDAGADDHVGKPFDLNELAARLRAISRRRGGRATPRLCAGELSLDPADLTLSFDGRVLVLPRREFSVLRVLMERPGTIRSRTEIEDQLYGWHEEVESNAVEVHIHNLRAKIGRERIETVRGVGYRLRSSR